MEEYNDHEKPAVLDYSKGTDLYQLGDSEVQHAWGGEDVKMPDIGFDLDHRQFLLHNILQPNDEGIITDSPPNPGEGPITDVAATQTKARENQDIGAVMGDDPEQTLEPEGSEFYDPFTDDLA
ncbi:hypothetical protein B0H14DRAFT_2633764 [Mycena olivaceomarginata]|nr:hypothetical protein B0H14DRAFT_2633764 [Mycena olivaceomarginata]